MKLFFNILAWLVSLWVSAQEIGATFSPSRSFVIAEYNCENLFDAQHDSLKDDYAFTPEGEYHWTRGKYWKKLNAVARGILNTGVWNEDYLRLPDIVALTEVENDSVLVSLTTRSLLRNADYKYVMTNSLDLRGIDVALLYSPKTFELKEWHAIRVPLEKPSRDILYVKGQMLDRSFLHVFLVHAPSRRGGELATRNLRLAFADAVSRSVDSLRSVDPMSQVLILGDFNDYKDSPSILRLLKYGLKNVSIDAVAVSSDDRMCVRTRTDVHGTYKFQGEWNSLDHILISESLAGRFLSCNIIANNDMLNRDKRYGGVAPKRFLKGPVAQDGYSDHLPLRAIFLLRNIETILDINP